MLKTAVFYQKIKIYRQPNLAILKQNNEAPLISETQNSLLKYCYHIQPETAHH